MKKIIALFLLVVMILSIAVITVSAQDTQISDEFLNAVRVDYGNEEINKEDIHIRFMKLISDDKYIVKYSVSGYAYRSDMVDIEVGGYVLNTNRPEPVIYKNGVIYEIQNAYEQGVINDDDLYTMSTFEQLNMVRSKITKELQDKMRRYESDEFVAVRFTLDGSDKYIGDIPNWIEDISGAVAQLNEHYENLHKQLLSEVLADFEYREVAHNEGISVVEVKQGDIEKISQYDLITQMEYISEIHRKYIDCYTPNFKGYVYDEKTVGYDDNGDLEWVLIKAHNTLGATAVVGFKFGDIVINSESIYSNFTYKFGIYDVKEDKFYDIYDLKETPDKYDNLESVLGFYAKARPLGDADGDRNITVLDATSIQRFLANLEWFWDDQYVDHESDTQGYVSDIDCDGDVTILDATYIQHKIALLK